ncbi:hypothetical protein AAF712_012641 [Marasmius tenuissimus]|uniref:Uncharacterized protein n=1 Tax=Marasmius tenuissimus TaxID=585030 RepID=A0ABR2ZGZ5_9AGAR|nr:hypothetical protein PM082_018615 [Marasmius tenuissimus]
MKLSAVLAILAFTATGALACSGNAHANQPCTGAGSCGDEALGLCGSAGFVCQGGTCKSKPQINSGTQEYLDDLKLRSFSEKPGVYCAKGSGECQSGSTCVSGDPTVGKNYGPAHCS